MAFKTANVSEQIGLNKRLDRTNFRVFSEGPTTNQKNYKESTVLARVNENLAGNLRPKQKHFYERVPQERMDEFHQMRSVDIDRKQKLVNNRFPELSAARQAFLGNEGKLPNKKIQADEVVNFANVVEKLAQEEEPSRPRLNQIGQDPNFQDSRRRSEQVGSNRTTSRLENIAKPTLSASIKTKYIVRSRHNELTSTRFIPVNSSQAKQVVRKEMIHDAGEPVRVDHEIMQRSSMVMRSIHGDSVFKTTSPVTQDQFIAKPKSTLDSNNDFSKFCPAEKKQKNARLAVLDNFKEISRIMTQNYMAHKKLEKRYEKTALPKSELSKMREEQNAQQRMTSILKKMHSPSNFAAPENLLPGQFKSNPYRSALGHHTRNASVMHNGTDRDNVSNNSPASNRQRGRFKSSEKVKASTMDDEIY